MHDHEPDHDDEDWYDDEDADSDEVDCPECGESMSADADHCPHCGHWISDDDHRVHGTDGGPSKRVRIIAAILLAAFLLGLLADLFLL